MNLKLHNLQIGQTGTHEGKPCEISDLIDELTIEVYGKFGKTFQWTFSFKSWFHKLFDIRDWKLEEYEHDKHLTISFYNFEKHG